MNKFYYSYYYYYYYYFSYNYREIQTLLIELETAFQEFQEYVNRTRVYYEQGIVQNRLQSDIYLSIYFYLPVFAYIFAFL